MGRIQTGFLLAGLCAVLSRWHYSSQPLYIDRISSQVDHLHSLQHLDNASSISSAVHDAARILTATPGGDVRATRRAATQRSIAQQVDWLNSLIEPAVPRSLWRRLPRFCQCWLRNLLFAQLVYFGVGLGWAYYIYQCFGGDLFPSGSMPTWRDMREQMQVAFGALPLYALLPSVTEELCERGFTLTYAHVADVGLPRLCAYLVLYMAFVEFGVYWMHRGLHDVKAGYKALHYVHHKYNKEAALSPFAGLAFHPLDGILQALPYAAALFIVPMHFLMHEFLLFATALWTTNIHDTLHANLLPVMGAGWHTIHHTTYKHNYGHYFVIMDWLHGTLISPEEFEAREKARATGGVKVIPAK